MGKSVQKEGRKGEPIYTIYEAAGDAKASNDPLVVWDNQLHVGCEL
jgi:hypothetical protein